MMMIEINIPNANAKAQFPDGVSEEDIKRSIDNYLKRSYIDMTQPEATRRSVQEGTQKVSAAAPKGTSEKVVKQLEAKGLKIEYYDPEKRMDAVKKLDKKSGGNILFSGAGAAILYGATRSDDESKTKNQTN